MMIIQEYAWIEKNRYLIGSPNYTVLANQLKPPT